MGLAPAVSAEVKPVEGTESTAPLGNPADIPDPTKIPCKFDPKCLRYNCHFFHPSRVPGSRHKVLIVNHGNNTVVGNTSERLFALETAEKVGMEVDS
jgi:hypothetical protein